MVVFLDLEEDSLEPDDPRQGPFSSSKLYPANGEHPAKVDENEIYTNVQHANLGAAGFSAILACYPVVTQLASSLDLNTLHALSRVCRQFRANLLQFLRQLIPRTLRCTSELEAAYNDVDPSILRFRSWDVVGSYGIPPIRITSGKIGPCARDMNCITKPRSAKALPLRLRRLCPTCARVPLVEVIDSPVVAGNDEAFTARAFARDACSCEDMAFICQPCGHVISNADINYRRIWEWRSRYSAYLGGLGTGIGEGNEGVKCGRGDRCLAGQDIEMETDCRSEDLSNLSWVSVESGERGEETVLEAIDQDGQKAGYLRQEIEGIGGVVVKKFKKQVRVGRAVEEHEDEREKCDYMAREARGEIRSWCDWCNRVVPSRGTKQAC